MTARIELVSSSPDGINTWIIGDRDEVIVIDPGRDPAAVLDVVADREVLAVICTHGHIPAFPVSDSAEELSARYARLLPVMPQLGPCGGS